jgi:hypothetical protein
MGIKAATGPKAEGAKASALEGLEKFANGFALLGGVLLGAHLLSKAAQAASGPATGAQTGAELGTGKPYRRKDNSLEELIRENNAELAQLQWHSPSDILEGVREFSRKEPDLGGAASPGVSLGSVQKDLYGAAPVIKDRSGGRTKADVQHRAGGADPLRDESAINVKREVLKFRHRKDAEHDRLDQRAEASNRENKQSDQTRGGVTRDVTADITNRALQDALRLQQDLLRDQIQSDYIKSTYRR